MGYWQMKWVLEKLFRVLPFLDIYQRFVAFGYLEGIVTKYIFFFPYSYYFLSIS